MSSGMRRMRINTQERAVSVDINRLQAFSHQEQAELLRHFLNVGTSLDDLALYIAPGSVAAPLRAEIINGLMVRPQAGTFDLLVDGGVLGALAPDGGADDSNYKIIRDAGVGLVGVLAMASNGSGSTRIDVIECRINPVEAIVTDNRDIFNTVTGAFVAASVTKELRGQLEYRVRQGTPGAGMPAHASGWLPLCVARVPDTAASNDDITFWDVRPLVSDRARGVMNLDDLPTVDGTEMRWIRASSSSVLLNGYARATLNGRRVGGMLRRGSPGADADSVDVANAANMSGTITEPLTGNVYLYIATPHGLPRWARYTASNPREPRAPIGIVISSYTAPDLNGRPSSPLALPAALDLGGTTSEAVCFGIIGRTASPSPNQWAAGSSTNRIFGYGGSYGSGGSVSVAHDGPSLSFPFQVTDTIWPAFTKAVFVDAVATLSIPANTNIGLQAELIVYDDLAGTNIVQRVVETVALSNATGSSAFVSFNMRARLMTPVAKPGALPSPRLVRFGVNPGAASISGNGTLAIMGYEF